MKHIKNWGEVQLLEIGSIYSGGTPSTKDEFNFNGDIPWVTPADLSDYKEKHISTGRRKITQKGLVSSSAVLLPKGSILFSSRAPIGYVVISMNPVTTNQGFKNLVVSDLIYNEYIYYYLKGNKDLIEGFASGTTFKEISARNFGKIPVPIPPLNEQHRIVEKIEELFTKLDAGVEVLEKIKKHLKRFRQSILKAAFSGQLTDDWRKKHSEDVGAAPSRPFGSSISDNHRVAATPSLQNGNLPDGWEWNSGRDVFTLITSGSRGWARYYSEDGPIFLRMGNLDHNSISLDLKNIQHVRPPKMAEGLRTKVQSGDILVSITADVGMIALIPEKFGESYINQHIALCRPKKEVNPKFVAWYLVCQDGGEQFQKMKRGATKIGLGLDGIRTMKIPIAKEEEQRQIISEIERRFSVADEVERMVNNALKQAQRLRQSILKRAFEGKLVPQDPNDEPAEKLLERIKAKKAKLTETKKSGKKK